MNKTDLIRAIHRVRGGSISETGYFLEVVLDTITKELENGGDIALQGFGSFTPWHQHERPGRNPKSGEPVQIQARTSVKFKPGKVLIEVLNKK
ncbi:MAG: HU family DNA-binding protein [Parabacteroides sp.]|nr:HU family DNA-binding protein [Parabacteroides sp.]